MGIIEHETGNPDLKRLLKEFDDTYDDSTEVRGEGLNLSCDIYSDSICYTIVYKMNISHTGPTIVCEPVNGKEVTMTVRDLWNDIRLLPARSNELLKDSNPEECRERLLIGMASCCGSSVKSGISAGAGRNGGHSGTKSGPAGRVPTGVMSCPVWPDGVADMQRTGIGRRLKAPGTLCRELPVCGARRYPADRRARFRSARWCGADSPGRFVDWFSDRPVCMARPGGTSCRNGAFRLQGVRLAVSG